MSAPRLVSLDPSKGRATKRRHSTKTKCARAVAFIRSRFDIDPDWPTPNQNEDDFSPNAPTKVRLSLSLSLSLSFSLFLSLSFFLSLPALSPFSVSPPPPPATPTPQDSPEFKRLADAIPPTRIAQRMNVLAKPRDVFAHFDDDMSGYLDEEEFETMLKTLDPTLTEEEVARTVLEVDRDGTRQITRQEFFSWWLGEGKEEEKQEKEGPRRPLARRLSALMESRQVHFWAKPQAVHLVVSFRANHIF